ncbi:hypothetical protein GGR54DRAFT_641739 [Hypoxylon sp. NC1633]|nr:hypothetical protein GGR54DRAFT_641739 [Hypoxylon sp. NC1633]
MLQRPRDIPAAHVLHPESTTPYLHRIHYHNHQQHEFNHHRVVARLQPVSNCQINSFTFDKTWNATKADLVAKWKKIQALRHPHRLKRSMVKRLSSRKKNIDNSQLLESTGNGDPHNETVRPVACTARPQAESSLVVEDSESVKSGAKQCVADHSACTEDSNTQNDGLQPGDLSQKQPRSADHMEGERKAGAAHRSSRCQPNHENRRGLTPEQYVAIKRQEVVAIVMAYFNRWLDKRLAVISCMSNCVVSIVILPLLLDLDIWWSGYAYEASEASGNSSCGSGGTGSGKNGSEQGQSGRSTRTKRRLGGDDEENSSAGGDEGDPSRGGSKRAKKDTEPEQKFACPYYKHDPRAHSKNRSCAGPGWTTLHRLKEHLYRVHRLPKHTCPRCNEPFDDARDLAEHIRADVPCGKLEKIPVLQGIDETTEAELKVRKKSCPSITDEQRWKDIYMILFPKANPKALPSPYYDAKDSAGLTGRVEDWKKFEKRIRKELPNIVQNEVQKSFDKVEAEVLTGLPDIVRNCLYKITRGFSHDDQSPSVTPAATPRAPTPSFPIERDDDATTTDEVKDFPLDLYTFDPDPDMPFNLGGFSDLDFTAQFDFGNSAEFLEKESDSGYASTGTARDCLAEVES